MRIAVTGKGGSGKTVLTAAMTGLAAPGRRLLAIDADSAVSLPWALGLGPGRSVADIRHQIIEDPEARARMDDRSIADVMQEILVPGPGFQLLVMGRPEGPGCYCAVNELLRYGIDTLSSRFDVTLIDCEAGPEQLSRRVLKAVDTLLIVSDPGKRGLRVASLIASIARQDEAIRPARMGLVINRYPGGDGPVEKLASGTGLEVLVLVPEDPAVPAADAAGRPITDLPSDSPFVREARRLVERIIP